MESAPVTARPAGVAALQFLGDMARLLTETAVTAADGTTLSLQDGLGRALALVHATRDGGGRVLLIGNGGSAAIASHLAVDMWKNGGLDAMAFNDPTALTCVSNDCGYENVFAEPILRFARPGDTLVAVSSSGESPNILRAVEAARQRGCHVVGFSGFAPDNPLRSRGDVNFYLASFIYGLVEAGHLALLHSILNEHLGYPRPGAGPIHPEQGATSA